MEGLERLTGRRLRTGFVSYRGALVPPALRRGGARSQVRHVASKVARFAVRLPRERRFARAMSPARSLHPLLLEPSYWRGRAQALEAHEGGVIWTPRPDLEAPGIRVLEFRMRNLDGGHLRGLFARCTWRNGPQAAVLRTVRPASRLEIHKDEVRDGVAEFVLQESAGRPLADRVLDVVLLSQVATETDGITHVEVDHGANRGGSDAAAIAQQLLIHRIVSPSADDPNL